MYVNEILALQVVLNQVKEEAQQLALIFQTVGAFKVKRKGGKGKQIFGTWVLPRQTELTNFVHVTFPIISSKSLPFHFS